MNKRQIYSFLLLMASGLTAIGCGSSGSSSMEMTDNGTTNTTGGLTVNLTRSAQGTAGAFMDVNGDGWADQVVTAPAASSSPQRGAVLIYLGSSTGFSSTPIELKGEGEGDSFGSSFLPIDLDGDGKKTDFAIGALTAEGDAPLSGVLYVYKGGDTPALVATLRGEGSMDKFGWSMASGDVDGDGKNDIVVSALYNTNAQFQGGAVYVYLGDGAKVSETPAVVLYDSAGASKGLGYSLAAGDISGDGKADILAGESSRVMIWYGRADIPAMSFSSPSVIINGVPVAVGGKGGSGFGKTVAVVGDVNGDTFNDIAIGNPNRSWHNIYDNKGSVYLFKGGAALPATLYVPEKTTDGAIDSANTSYPYLISKLTGQNTQDRFGSFILPVGDVVNHNKEFIAGGKPDFVVTAVWGDADNTVSSGKATGKAYLFSGEHLVSMSGMEMSASHADKEYLGDATGSGFGTFCSISREGLNAEGKTGVLIVGVPFTSQGTGGIKMFTLSSGSAVTGGATGGTSTGGGLDCH